MSDLQAERDVELDCFRVQRVVAAVVGRQSPEPGNDAQGAEAELANAASQLANTVHRTEEVDRGGSDQAVRVLADAGLISHEKRGRERVCRLEPLAMQQAADWLEQYREFWQAQLDNLAAFLEDNNETQPRDDDEL